MRVSSSALLTNLHIVGFYVYQNKSTVALELLQERYDSSCEQWESHCELRVKEATKKAEEESEQRLKMWQNEVESKLRQLVTTLEQQLGILKTK